MTLEILFLGFCFLIASILCSATMNSQHRKRYAYIMSTSHVTLKKPGFLNKTLEREIFVNGKFVPDTAYNEACAKNADYDLSLIYALEAQEPTPANMFQRVKSWIGFKL